jgi:hypothetical protein
MTDFELSFQFPIKRVGASPEVFAASAGSEAADSDAAGSADASTDASAEIDGSAAGVASSLSFPEFEITIAAKITTPTRTARRVLVEDPWRGAADGGADLTAGFGAAGVVETLTRADPVAGTGGTTIADAATFFADDFFAGDFFATFLGAAFFVVVFLATAFLATAFFAGDFFATFLGAAFLATDFFFTATVYLLEFRNGGI